MPIKRMNIPRREKAVRREKTVSNKKRSLPEQQENFVLTVNDNGETREFCLNTEEYQEFLLKYEEKELI